MTFLNLIKFYMTLGLAAVTTKNSQNFPRFKVFFDLKLVLALSSAVTNLPNKTLIFDDFQPPTIKFHDFPGLGNEILKILIP